MANNILVVAKSATTRNMIKIYLMNLKHAILDAEDTYRALQMLRLVPVALIVVDSDVGVEAASFIGELRSNPMTQLQTIPVVLAARAAEAELRQQAEAAGVSAIINRPISHAELTAVATRLLGSAG